MNQYFSAVMLFSQYGDFVRIFLFPLIHYFKCISYKYIQITIALFHRPDANCKVCQNNITADNTCLPGISLLTRKTLKQTEKTSIQTMMWQSINSISHCKFLQSIYIDIYIFFNIQMIPSINDVNTGTFVSPALILTVFKES